MKVTPKFVISWLLFAAIIFSHCIFSETMVREAFADFVYFSFPYILGYGVATNEISINFLKKNV